MTNPFENFKLQPSFKNRSFEHPQVEHNKVYDNVILTVYINKKKDPQRNIFIDKDSYGYIKPLYLTMVEQNLHGIIFYDNLSPDFVNKYQTDKIIFLKCSISDKSINDERFFVYYNFLLKYPYKKVLCSDVSDVYINKNPFDLISDKKLYVGTNHNHKKPPERWYDYYKKKIDKFNKLIKNHGINSIFTKKDIGIYNKTNAYLVLSFVEEC